ncbi:chaplin family protein [Streptomyces olivaceoviridis]|uniref:chaplin family protein n=1 Tax=Streptomyces olivaceoviridis TaxID=1921 RepID=UPI003691F4CC
MRRTLGKGMAVAAVAAGVLSLYGGSALADSRAQGAAWMPHGDDIQAPANLSVDACGNSHDAAAALNPAAADSCATMTTHVRPGQGAGRPSEEPAGPGHGGSDHSDDRPGPGGDHSTPLSGGETTPPPHSGEETTRLPYGAGDRTPPGGGHGTLPGGGHITAPSGGETTPPVAGHTPPPGGGDGEFPGQSPMLSHTGGAGPAMIAPSAVSAALIAAGVFLYRRGRSAARR